MSLSPTEGSKVREAVNPNKISFTYSSQKINWLFLPDETPSPVTAGALSRCEKMLTFDTFDIFPLTSLLPIAMKQFMNRVKEAIFIISLNGWWWRISH